MNRKGNRFVGVIIIIIGISILLNIFGFNMMLMGPLVLFAFGGLFYVKGHHWIGMVFFALSVIAFFNTVFDIEVGGVFVALAFIYFGYRLMNGKGKTKKVKKNKKHGDPAVDEEKTEDDVDDWLDHEIEKLNKEQPEVEKDDEQVAEKEEPKRKAEKKQRHNVEPPEVTVSTPKFRNSLIGEFSLMGRRYELQDMNVSHGIGDVKIDLSKAIIPEGETSLVISCFIGDVDIYVPYDLDVAVSSSVTIGDLEILGYQQGGINRHINLATKGYKDSTRKVKISVSAFIGDIDVRHL